ncbi:DUF1611 domain-containing protein [Acetatifactor muris]|uniref:Uncharacterized protein n=1 Tax=Acetatifactor muris TaxID=879566 RepID=A0A2K4ZK24_9FIRM|nr:DUF1611 domain-containing protein [Acetatifactor muris]MCR2049036.1 DUF1611 domain-containing protein [Acetatifactor muris]SOY30821.1 hypothetical protein AMURIS_03552 [Acetatifactor muris]
MKIPRIAIIDSGISSDQKDSVYKINVLGKCRSHIDKIGHGSVIAQIIKNYSPNVLIRCIKITDDDEIQEEFLCQALKLLLDDLDVDIVNISMGIVVSEMLDEISDLCLQLRSKGVVIVSAFDNDGAMSYPAALPFVIGVDTSHRCKLINQYEFVQSDIINLRAFSEVLHIKIGNKVFSVSGTSYACAIMTAKVAELLYSGNVDAANILHKLEEDAAYVFEKKEYEDVPEMPNINKAIIFPFNKEMNALLANQDLLNFEVVDIFDPVQLGNIGRRLSDILIGDMEKDFSIKNIFKADWSLDFDGVILGHTREISETLNFDFKDYIVKQCIKYNKILYSFDNVIAPKELTYYVPQVLDINVPNNRFGKLYQVHCPVLGVFGTSSKQGKFSLQLKLRRQFLNSNYKLSQIGTEPSSLLFGMDAVYPSGYDGIIPKKSQDSILVLNDILNKIVVADTDIALVGAQSGANVYSCQNISLFPLETFNLLLATQPDAILLCVNTYDDDEYIYRTIMILENMINTYVIALVVSPVAHKYIDSGLSRQTFQEEKSKVKNFMKHLEEQFKKKVFMLDFEDDTSDIFEYCIKTLGEGSIGDDL